MLENISSTYEQFVSVRLAAVSDSSVQRLLNRGIRPESIPEIQRRLRTINALIEPAQLIDKVFSPSSNPNHPTPFPKTRFSDGDFAVFYSALEDETSIEEVKHHQSQSGEFDDLKYSDNSAPRHFNLFEIDVEGSVLELFPIHADFPELTSEDESGYPKCRDIAEEARRNSIDAFRTPSARKMGGTCTPVFTRQSLPNDPRIKSYGKFISRNGEISYQTL
jgi:hypothetical protein